MNNIIQAAFSGGRTASTKPKHRYDYGQVLKISGFDLPDVYEVHFANSGQQTALRMIASGDEVDVPDELFRTGADIDCWIFVHDTEMDGTTVYRIRIPVSDRPMPEDYEPTPEEAGLVEQAIALLNQEIEDIENAHNNAVAAQEAQAAAEYAQEEAEAAKHSAKNSEDLAMEYMLGAYNARGDALRSERNAKASEEAAEAAAELAEQHNMGVTTTGNTLVFASRT